MTAGFGSFHARDALYTVWAGPHLTVGHHSNGQQGCTLASEEAEFDQAERGRCPPSS